MADIQYLNYGDQQIEQQALLNNLANQVQGYVQKQPWSNKRKEMFMSAYSELMNRGIQGASNTNGQWMLNVGGDTPLDLDSKSKKEKEMYQEAAYFIQQQMAGLPTKSSQEQKKEEDKKNLPLFDNAYFTREFGNHISNSMFGGRKIDTQTDWNSLDERDKTKGLRGRTNRAKALSNMLQSYSDSLEEGKYNFEGSPFKDLTDFKTRIGAAIQALNTPDESDDIPALNAIGLRASDWFNNGSGDPFKTEGYEGTYGDYYGRFLPQQEKDKAKAEAEKQKAQQANYWSGYKYYNLSKYNGRPLTSEESNVKHLNEIISKDKWSGDEASQIVQAFKLAERNGQLVSITDKNELAKFGPMWKNRVKQLRKINGIEGIYYDTVGKRFVKPYKNGQTPQTSFQDILDQNNPKALKEKQNQQSAVNMNTPLSQMTEWTPEMKKEIEAIAWDAASILNPEAFTGSAMALNAARLRGEANPNRSTLEKILDYGTAGLGGIQGFGDLLVTGKVGYRLYQLGKSIGSVSKFAGILGAGFGAIGAYEAKDSIAKLATDYESLTPQDIENISYGLMGLIGLKSFAKARNKQTIGKQANPTTTEYNITFKDKNGKTHEVKVDEATAREINNSYGYGKKKADVDSKTFNHAKVKEAVQKYNKEKNPTEKLELEGASIQSSSKLGRVTGKDAVKPKQVKNLNAPEYVPVGNKWYSPFGYMAQGNNKWGYYLGGGWQRKAWENAAPEHSSKGLWQRAKEFWNPEPVVKNKTSSIETPNSAETSKTRPTNTELYNKNTQYEYNILNTPNKNNSRLLQKGDSQSATLIDGNTYRFVYSNEGEAIVMLNGKPVLNPVKVKNQKEAKEEFSKFVKNLNSRIASQNQNQFLKRFESGKYLESIRELKRKGFFLKQGGTIDRQKIQKYKEFINK